MTVKRLKEILAEAKDENEVVIRIENPGGFICPDGAYVGVSCVAPEGMDWHTGLTEIFPENKLAVVNVDNWSKRIKEL